jgi:hypothetical protein
VAKSFTDYRGRGFWAHDGLLCVWLAALADVVPDDDAPPWLREAEQHWREQAGVGFMGCVDAGLDKLLASPQRAQVVLGLAETASRCLAGATDSIGYLPASWLNDRHISGEMSWTSRNIRYDYVRRIADAFSALLRDELQTTPATSPVLPRLSQEPESPIDRSG